MARIKFDRGIHATWITCAVLLTAGQAQAAPQVLALITTDRPVSLQCDATDCRAELPTLCLQPERRAPETGRGYRLAKGQTVALSGRGADGVMKSIAVGREIQFTARRTHVAVEARISRKALAQFGLAEPAIGVAQAVTVTPAAKVGDARPLTAPETAEATRHRRALAAALVDGDTERMPAVRLTNRLINALPIEGKADPNFRRRLWSRLRKDARRGGISDTALERAQFNVSLCTYNADSGRSPSLRRCLQGYNDDAMEYLNSDLESALRTGS